MALPYNPDAFNTPGVAVSPLSIKRYFPSSKAPIGTWAELWFGMSSHIDPGYKSDDPATVAAQVATVLARGFDFIVLDWYGTQLAVPHTAALLWMAECEKQGLKFIIDFNKGIFQFGMPASTAPTIWGQKMMDFAVQKFMASPAYMKTVDGRSLMCTWDTGAVTGLDLGKVFGAYPQVAVLYDKATGVSQPHSAGCYGWVGFDPTNPEGAIEAYQTSFLIAAMKAKAANPKLLVMASVAKGFDDHGRRGTLDPTKICWDQTKPYRFVDEKQGQTLLNAIAVVNKFQPDYIFFPTLNDYDENTASVERGIDSQVTVALSVAQGVPKIELAGNLNTVDSVVLMVNGKMAATFAPAAEATFDLGGLVPAAGATTFACQAAALGKPLFQTKFSNVVTATATVVPDQTVQVDVPVHIDTTVGVSVSGSESGLSVQGMVIVPVQQDSTVTVDAVVTTRTIWS